MLKKCKAIIDDWFLFHFYLKLLKKYQKQAIFFNISKMQWNQKYRIIALNYDESNISIYFGVRSL